MFRKSPEQFLVASDERYVESLCKRYELWLYFGFDMVFVKGVVMLISLLCIHCFMIIFYVVKDTLKQRHPAF